MLTRYLVILCVLCALCGKSVFSAENYIQLPPNSTGAKTRTVNQTINTNDVHQPGQLVCDPLDADCADVGNEAADAKGVNVLPLGVAADDFYPYNTPPALTTGQTYPFLLEPDGKLIVHSSVSTDEGSFDDHFNGAALGADWTSATGTGGSIAVSGGQVTIGGGTTINANTYICIPVDYAPMRATAWLSISQRIANQNIKMDLTDNCTPASETSFVRYNWTGTTVTQVYAETQSQSGNTEGLASPLTQTTSATSMAYTIEWTGNTAAFSYGPTNNIDEGVLLAHRHVELPNNTTKLYLRIGIFNGGTAPGSNTNVVVKRVRTENTYNLQVGNMFSAAPLKSYAMGVARTAPPVPTEDDHPVLPMYDSIGRAVSAGACPRDLSTDQQATITSSSSETTILTSASGYHQDLTSLDITNASATAVTVTIKDSTAGTTRAIYDLAANGGLVKIWPTPFVQRSATGNNWTATLSNATTTVHFTTQACKMP